MATTATTVESLVDPAVARYRARYDAARTALPGAGQRWVAALRDRAAGVLAERGFPTIKVEAWKYTDLRRLFRTDFGEAASGPAPDGAAIAPHLFGASGAALVFVDGAFAPALSRLDGLPEGVRLVPLSEALEAGDPGAEAILAASPALDRPGLGALNTALMQDGVLIEIGDGVTPERPIELVCLTTDGWAGEAHLRTLVALGAGARATLAVRHAGLGNAEGLIDIVGDIVIGDGARLDLVKLQQEAGRVTHIAQTHVRLGRDAAFDAFTLNAGGRLARNEVCVRLGGQGADCALNGLSLLRGRQHCDSTTDVDHAVPHGRSAQVFKNIVDDRAHSVYLGRIHVAPDAQKTDSSQLSRNLLLSRGAQADTKPELVIHADDVKCSHGATVGDLDREALFYLRSRGIGADEARRLLLEGFAGEMLAMIGDEAVREAAGGALAGWLAAGKKERRAA